MKRLSSAWIVALLLTGCGGDGASGPAAPAPERATFEDRRLQFPGSAWVVVENPGAWGWSSERLERARERFEALDSATLMVVHRGVLIASWGPVDERYIAQSIRKALLGALLGQEVAAGRLDLEATLAELEIDDRSQPLTEVERSARVLDLLRSSAGIYLSSIYEAPSWKRSKPERGSSIPGAAWFYNNWEFNVLGTIFERVSGTSIQDAFAERVAEPLGMQDFRPRDVLYLTASSLTERIMGNDSEHPAYMFSISSRDLARFGLMVLAEGRWDGLQVVPQSWIEQSLVTGLVDTHPRFGGDRYGYLWWVSPTASAMGQAAGATLFKATGGRGHKLLVIPDLELVIVHRLDETGVGLLDQLGRRFLGGPSVGERDFTELLRLLVAAHPDRL